MKIWIGNNEQGRAGTCGDAEEVLVGSRGHVLPEEGEPQNHLKERTAQYIARPRYWWCDKSSSGG